jgi:hypothetical protein
MAGLAAEIPHPSASTLGARDEFRLAPDDEEVNPPDGV